MMNYYGFDQMPYFNTFAPTMGIFFVAILAWSLYWKGMALWKAARLGDKNWFIALLVINTMGILDILYIYNFSDKKGHKKE